MKRRVISCSIICMLLLLNGCGAKQKREYKEEKIEDIRISQPNNYIDCDDAILIKGSNNYQCVNTQLLYNEETEIYTCIIEFKKIISE